MRGALAGGGRGRREALVEGAGGLCEVGGHLAGDGCRLGDLCGGVLGDVGALPGPGRCAVQEGGEVWELTGGVFEDGSLLVAGERCV
ncbi:hypothetical protein ACWGDX_19420 [Streptomyces sp. NPDC055025]